MIDLVGGTLEEPGRRQVRAQDARVKADEGVTEGGFQRFIAGENLDLSALGRGRWRERHLTPTPQHQSRNTVVGLGDEHDTLDQRQLQIFSEHDQVRGVVLLRRVEGQTIQSVDRVEHLLVRDLPRPVVRRRVQVGPPYVELPGRETGAPALLDEDLDHQPITCPLGCVRERRPEALERNGPGHTRLNLIVREGQRLRTVRARRDERQVVGRFASLDHLCEPL